MLLLSTVILFSAIPIIKSLYVIEQNTRAVQKDTARLLSKIERVEEVYNKFEKVMLHIKNLRVD